MARSCRQCSSAFDVTQDDLAFYKKVSPVFAGKKELIPPPTLCPDCRQQRRLAWRNERTLYRRPCDLCGNAILSCFSPDKPHPVYCFACWWGDGWDALSFGRPMDFRRPFFPQLRELMDQVPMNHMSLFRPENSDYCNQAGNVKNCYLCFNAIESESCLYCKGLYRCRDCADCLKIYDCELCYGCIDCHRCYRCFDSIQCDNCSECHLCRDCTGCIGCIGCTNLRNKRFFLHNRPSTEEEVRRETARIAAQSGRAAARERWQQMDRRSPRRSSLIIHCENCTGDSVYESRNASHCFDVVGAEDVAYGYDLRETSFSSRDISFIGNDIQSSYETVSCGIHADHILLADNCWDSVSDILYSSYVHQSEHCFGCTGLRRKKYCILNRQYTEEKYKLLVSKIIEHMRKTGEWGEFFPANIARFAYNETVAQEYFPLSKEEVLKRGWKWRDETDEMPKVERIIPASQLPDAIDDVPDLSAPSTMLGTGSALAKADDILQWAIECEATKRPFKIIKQELEFYRKMRLPVPRLHPDERHRRRMALRNPRKLWDRECAKCGNPITTSYPPERPEIVYCESCYLAIVY